MARAGEGGKALFEVVDIGASDEGRGFDHTTDGGIKLGLEALVLSVKVNEVHQINNSLISDRRIREISKRFNVQTSS